MPLFIRHRLLCLKYEAHLLKFSDHPCVSLFKDCWQEGFPDTSDFCSFNLFTKTEFSQNNFTGDTLQISNLPTWVLRKPVVDLTLLHFVHQTRSVFIAPVFASHLHNMYDQFFRICTDGSKTLTKAGCGIYIADKNLKYSIAINPFSTSVTSELFTVLQALYLIYSLKTRRAVIVASSLSSLQAITNWNWKKHSFVTRLSSFVFLLIKLFLAMNWLINWQNSPLQNPQLTHSQTFSINMSLLGLMFPICFPYFPNFVSNCGNTIMSLTGRAMLTKPFFQSYPNHRWYTTANTPPLYLDYLQVTVGLTIIFSVLDSIPTGCVITAQSQKL